MPPNLRKYYLITFASRNSSIHWKWRFLTVKWNEFHKTFSARLDRRFRSISEVSFIRWKTVHVQKLSDRKWWLTDADPREVSSKIIKMCSNEFWVFKFRKFSQLASLAVFPLFFSTTRWANVVWLGRGQVGEGGHPQGNIKGEGGPIFGRTIFGGLFSEGGGAHFRILPCGARISSHAPGFRCNSLLEHCMKR